MFRYEVLTKATIGGQSVWADKHNGAYGYAVCIQTVDWARFTPIRWCVRGVS